MTARIKLSNPDTMAKPGGTYSHVARVKAGELIFIAGQVALDANGKVAGPDIETQAEQVFKNIRAALQSEGADMKHIVQLTTYLTDAADIPKFRKYREGAYPTLFPDGKYPPNTLLVIDQLASPAIRLEIAVIAAPE
jgi:enamine deaminase RidA (YjgF/YER057c/UK114 family)